MNIVLFVRVLGLLISESLFINCLKVNAIGTIRVITTLPTSTFQGLDNNYLS